MNWKRVLFPFWREKNKKRVKRKVRPRNSAFFFWPLGDQKKRAVTCTKDFVGNNGTNPPYFEDQIKKLKLPYLYHKVLAFWHVELQNFSNFSLWPTCSQIWLNSSCGWSPVHLLPPKWEKKSLPRIPKSNGHDFPLFFPHSQFPGPLPRGVCAKAAKITPGCHEWLFSTWK
jgi:hypothetical protein